jgi:hexokinase
MKLHSGPKEFLEDIAAQFAMGPAETRDLMRAFRDMMKKGLSGGRSCLKMLPTYCDVASGREKGRLVALDFGGTNFRIIDAELLGRGKVRIHAIKKMPIPRALMKGSGERLFDFVAHAVDGFVEGRRLERGERIGLGFTFSFPIRQLGIKRGRLLSWTKGFAAQGVVGRDVVECLEDALKRNGAGKILVRALLNDTVGTLAAGSYADPACDVGAIFGTGTNACYREKRRRMIINIEWGDFSVLTRNEFDIALDRATNNPGRQLMEKMMSGMYIGELARLVIMKAARGGVFTGDVSLKKGAFMTEDMASIASVRLRGVGPGDMKIIRRICALVSRRAARISAAALAAVIAHIDPIISRRHVIAVDGRLYESYPGFRGEIARTLKEIHPRRHRRIKLTHVKDGSGLGAAVVAAMNS